MKGNRTAKGQTTAAVHSIYRSGDRVLVELSFGFCEVVIHRHEISDGRLLLYGVAAGMALSFPATKVAARMAPDEALGWPEAV